MVRDEAVNTVGVKIGKSGFVGVAGVRGDNQSISIDITADASRWYRALVPSSTGISA